jgi:REP element-mobilizing transposase RayT
MPNTFSQMYAHCVWAVKKRQPLIPAEHRVEVHQYITEIISRRKQKLISIFCMPDHIHLMIGFQPNVNVSDLVRDIIL